MTLSQNCGRLASKKTTHRKDEAVDLYACFSEDALYYAEQWDGTTVAVETGDMFRVKYQLTS